MRILHDEFLKYLRENVPVGQTLFDVTIWPTGECEVSAVNLNESIRPAGADEILVLSGRVRIICNFIKVGHPLPARVIDIE